MFYSTSCSCTIHVHVDADYELNRDTGPKEHSINSGSKVHVPGTENKIEAHQETEHGPKTTYRLTDRIQAMHACKLDIGLENKTWIRWVIYKIKT